MMTKSGPRKSQSPSELIDARIKELGDWRGERLGRLRALIKEADPAVVEEWKWRGVPVWSHDGLICTGETYKNVVKATFAKGAALRDPSRLFNASLLIVSPSRKSMARLVFPSRLELKRPDGSFRAAPLAKVIFTTFL